MRKVSLLLVAGLALGISIQSCIFQNDPARPNSPPSISSYEPDVIVLTIEAPVDSIRFSIEASDVDRDALDYRFCLLGDDGEIVSVLHRGTSFVFKPTQGGFYHIRAIAEDHYEAAHRDWYVHVIELHNDPPEITWQSPDQDSITVLIGNILEFRVGVEDDHPDDLMYTYLVGGKIEEIDGTPEFFHRFMENGRFIVEGRVWDGEYGDTISWVVRVAGEPDTIPPSPIIDLSGRTGTEPGTIDLFWTAPGDDADDGRASHYRVRTHTIPILTESDWAEASQKNGVPVPGVAGSPESTTVENLIPGTWLFATARAVDDFGNMSELGNYIRLLVRGMDGQGVVLDALTGEPVPGIAVSAEGVIDTTDAAGRYSLPNLPVFTNTIRVRDGQEVAGPGEYYDLAWEFSELEYHFVQDFHLVPVLGIVSTDYDYYKGDFLYFLKDITLTRGLMGRPTIFRNWDHFPVTVHNPPMTWNGVDIQAVVRDAIATWNDGTGLELLAETGDPESADCVIEYDLENVYKHNVETVATNEDGTPVKKRIWIYPNNTLSPIHVKGLMIFSHELGHVLQLWHSNDLGHLMVGGTSPIVNTPTTDELRLIRILHNLPTIFDASFIKES